MSCDYVDCAVSNYVWESSDGWLVACAFHECVGIRSSTLSPLIFTLW